MACTQALLSIGLQAAASCLADEGFASSDDECMNDAAGTVDRGKQSQGEAGSGSVCGIACKNDIGLIVATKVYRIEVACVQALLNKYHISAAIYRTSKFRMAELQILC